MPLLLLIGLFVLVPIVEISLLIRVGNQIGLGSTILIVIVTAILGAYLVRQQGFATIRKLQDKMSQGELPAMQIAEGVVLLFAGAVLLTPGFLTDAIGFALLTPPIRRGLISWITKKGVFQAQNIGAAGQGHHERSQNDPGKVIEGEYRERK